MNPYTTVEERLSLLRVFVDREGHARVPARHEESGRGLGRWVDKWRRAHLNGALDTDLARTLEALPGWVWSGNEFMYERGLNALREYVAVAGHCNLRSEEILGGVELGKWVRRRTLEFERGELSDDRRAALEEIPGWFWDRRDRQLFAELRVWARWSEARNLLVPARNEAFRGFPIGHWHRDLEKKSAAGKLSPSAAAMVEKAGIILDVDAAHFATLLRAVKEHADRTGSLDIPWDVRVDGVLLARWFYRQQELARFGDLDMPRVHALARVIEEGTGEDVPDRFYLLAQSRRLEHEFRQAPAGLVSPPARRATWARMPVRELHDVVIG
ncbi:helicase associated domain-containing protein [Leifsonia sp. Leaf264]|uniref:helicase associated domain-containing protein n=1 Tax=Leifsonia sp. Leaf264 TaxID=1736314 RepID=UPI0006F8F55A|nr:helicase associated domain-containing protein [Leifsonia sp. Leaf264]KQO98552.1 hypothetical protein ASF30_10850 [Leifsonia sp. Leaf264]